MVPMALLLFSHPLTPTPSCAPGLFLQGAELLLQEQTFAGWTLQLSRSGRSTSKTLAGTQAGPCGSSGRASGAVIQEVPRPWP